MLPPNIDFEAKKFIERLLVVDPQKRPRAAEINADKFINIGRKPNLHSISISGDTKASF